jgi:pimeloyl-ACP methyl ester carboxylesterase
MPDSARLRVQFAHGLESNPQGEKARLFAEHFDACTPVMDTSDFESCVGVHAGVLMTFRPDLLIGSSFGGAVAVALLTRKLWRGPTLLLAQAALHYDPAARLPAGVPVTLVHGLRDDVVPIEESRRLAATAPESATLVEVDDGHRLSALVVSGELVELVRRAAAKR